MWLGGTAGGSSRRGRYGYRTVNRKNVYAHRHQWERMRGPIPPDMEVDHLCRVRRCVNIDHLRVVTRRVNLLAEGSVAPPAIAAARTHCNKGHLYDTVRRQRGRLVRGCKTCNCDYQKALRQRTVQIGAHIFYKENA